MTEFCCTVDEIRKAKLYEHLGANITMTEKGLGSYEDAIMQCPHDNLFMLNMTFFNEDGTEDILCDPATIKDLQEVIESRDHELKYLHKQNNGEALINTQCQNCFKCFKGFIYETCSCGKPMGTSMEMYNSWFYSVNQQLQAIRRRRPRFYTDSMEVHIVDDLKIDIYDFWRLDFKDAKIRYVIAKENKPAIDRPFGYVSHFAQVKGQPIGVNLTATYKSGKVSISVTTSAKDSDVGSYVRGDSPDFYQTTNLYEFGKFIKGLI